MKKLFYLLLMSVFSISTYAWTWSDPYQLYDGDKCVLFYKVNFDEGQLLIDTDWDKSGNPVPASDEGNSKTWIFYKTYYSYIIWIGDQWSGPLPWRRPYTEKNSSYAPYLGLKHLNFDTQLRNVGAYWFSSCPYLVDVNFLYSHDTKPLISEISEGAFKNCFQLTKLLYFEDHPIHKIGKYAFQNCSRLEELHLPARLYYSIGEKAFAGLASLRRVVVRSPDPPLYIAADVFEDTPVYNVLLEVPEGCLKKYMNADVWREFGRYKIRYNNNENITKDHNNEYINTKSITVWGDDRVAKGNTVKLSSSITPSNASFKTIKWTSSNPYIAAVDSNGNVTGLLPGTVTITATTEYGNRTAVHKIVVEPKITEIGLNTYDVYLTPGKEYGIRLTSLTHDALPDYSIIWSTNKSNVIKITPDGKSCMVEALTEGEATVSVKITTASGVFRNECHFEIHRYEKSLELNYAEIADKISNVYILRSNTYPANRDVKWEVFDAKIAEITDLGSTMCRIKLLKPGTTCIRCYYGDIIKDCKITVLSNEPDKIALSNHSLIIESGNETELTAIAANEVSWSASNNHVQLYPNNYSCRIKAIRSGPVTIRARTAGGAIDSCEIYIEPYSGKVFDRNRTKLTYSAVPGETVVIEPVLVAGAYPDSIEWKPFSPNTRITARRLSCSVYVDFTGFGLIEAKCNNETLTFKIQTVKSHTGIVMPDDDETVSIYSIMGRLLYVGRLSSYNRTNQLVIIKNSKGKVYKLLY